MTDDLSSCCGSLAMTVVDKTEGCFAALAMTADGSSWQMVLKGCFAALAMTVELS